MEDRKTDRPRSAGADLVLTDGISPLAVSNLIRGSMWIVFGSRSPRLASDTEVLEGDRIMQRDKDILDAS